MVVDTTHYDTLGVPPTATEPEMWSAFQKLVAIYHPDGGSNDPTARESLQDICVAFQVLSNDDWRRFYDKFGRGEWDLENGSVDAADYFAFIFAGIPFIDWFGESCYMETQLEKIHVGRQARIEEKEGLGPPAKDATDRYRAEASARSESALKEKGTDEEEELLARLRKRNHAIRKVPITKEEARNFDSLERKLLGRISAWTETGKDDEATVAFLERIRQEIEPLKAGVLGCEMLHCIGVVYVNQAAILLHSQKFFGVGVPFMRMRDKRLERHMVKSMLGGAYLEEAAHMKINIEEDKRLRQGGGELGDEVLVQYHRKVLGHMLTAEWIHHQATVQAVVRTVCELVLNDVEVPLSQRLDRARALKLVGDVLCQAERSTLVK